MQEFIADLEILSIFRVRDTGSDNCGSVRLGSRLHKARGRMCTQRHHARQVVYLFQMYIVKQIFYTQ